MLKSARAACCAGRRRLAVSRPGLPWSLIRNHDSIRHCVGDADALLLLRILHSFFFYSKVTKLQLFEITLNTAARRSAHCCCMQLARSLPLHVLDQLTHKPADVTSSRAPRCYSGQTSHTQTELLFFRNSRECNPLLNKSWFRLSYN